MKHYYRAAATADRKKLTEYTELDIENAIFDGANSPNPENPLWNTDLNMAFKDICNINDDQLKKAVVTLLQSILDPEFTRNAANAGFYIRSNLGQGLVQAVKAIKIQSKPMDLTPLDKIADKDAYKSPQNPDLNNSIKSMIFALRAYAEENCIKTVSTYEPRKPGEYKPAGFL